MMSKFASELMKGFLSRNQRYLWTDAYAVMNLLRLGKHAEARGLIDRVHMALARYHPDDERRGWLSGLPELEGSQRPTCAGLRIGKPLPERSPDEPVDPNLEWDRDGQYFHYLTRWAQALWHAGEQMPNEPYLKWARELMQAAQQFLYQSDSGPRMYWKMSVDLSRPLVTSMGHHDPLDGLVTSLCLGQLDTEPYREILVGQDLVSTDPLGIGGLLGAHTRLGTMQLLPQLRERTLRAALIGLRHYNWDLGPQASPIGRLGFRELGLAIGVTQCSNPDLDPYQEHAERLIEFWSREESRGTHLWQEHLDINEVMLATAHLSAKRI
jgi:hypothetical protein